MSRLLAIRQKLNLTQEELCERSGISVRTIQRIEAGMLPKGYTLKALAKGLGIREDELIEAEVPATGEDFKWVKLINLSSLPLMFVPPLNIVVPLLIMFFKKQFTPVNRKLITLQVVWGLVAVLIYLTIIILNDWFDIRSKFMVLIPILWLIINTFIILRNAVEIDRNKTLRISPNFSII